MQSEKLAQGFNTAAQNSNPGSRSREPLRSTTICVSDNAMKPAVPHLRGAAIGCRASNHGRSTERLCPVRDIATGGLEPQAA